MPRKKNGYDTDSPAARDYCQAIEDLRDHCEATDQNYRTVMIEIIEQRITDDLRGTDATRQKESEP